MALATSATRPDAVNGEFIGYCIKFDLNVGGAAAQLPESARPTRTRLTVRRRVVVGPQLAPASRGQPRRQRTNTNTGVAGRPVAGSLSPTSTSFPVAWIWRASAAWES
jgi:hypothetical protein